MRSSQSREKRLYFVLKRSFDFAGSLVILVAMMPFIILLFFLVWLIIGWPVFYTQLRPGRYGKPFKIFKFRTMSFDHDELGNLLPDKMRTRGIGRFIRKTSMDELPELFNVLIGDMSLVGPRPLLIKYLPYFTEREKKRHTVKPGITGLAQINGRNLLNWDERLEMDVKYVENISFGLDIKIFLTTIVNVIRQKDVLAVSSEIIPDFDDYRTDQLNNTRIGN